MALEPNPETVSGSVQHSVPPSPDRGAPIAARPVRETRPPRNSGYFVVIVLLIPHIIFGLCRRRGGLLLLRFLGDQISAADQGNSKQNSYR